MSTSLSNSLSRGLPGWVRHAWAQPGGDWLPSVRDTATAVVLTVIAVVAAYGEAHPSAHYFTPPYHPPDTPDAALLLVVVAGAVLAWRGRYPRLVLCASTAAVVAYTLPGNVNGVALLLPAVAMGSLASNPSTTWVRSSLWAAAVTAVLMAATASSNPLGPTGGGFFLIPANLAVALFAGIALGSRRAYLASERAQLARQSALEAQRGIDEERLRIARELHDVVAHTMATITVQASAATTLLHDRPEQAAESLQAIRTASKNGLRELRAILNVLRAVEGDPDGLADPVHPAAGLARLDALAAGVRAAGLPVTVSITGQPRELPTVTDLSAFRIIQEALTNTIRHAGPATAAVTAHYGADCLTVEVTDTGRVFSSSAEGAFAARLAIGAGHGLRGMRERAAAAGGVMEIGPLPDGGFRVNARFPLDPRADIEPADTEVTDPAQPASPAQPAGPASTIADPHRDRS